MCLISLYVQIYVFLFQAEKGLEEGRNSTQMDEGWERRVYVEKFEGCTPIKTYPYDILEDLPCDSGDQ